MKSLIAMTILVASFQASAVEKYLCGDEDIQLITQSVKEIPVLVGPEHHAALAKVLNQEKGLSCLGLTKVKAHPSAQGTQRSFYEISLEGKRKFKIVITKNDQQNEESYIAIHR